MDTLLVVPLRSFCTDEATFIRLIERVFADLKNGLELKDFAIAKHDPRRRAPAAASRFADAIELKPGAFGVSLDLKKLLFGENS